MSAIRHCAYFKIVKSGVKKTVCVSCWLQWFHIKVKTRPFMNDSGHRSRFLMGFVAL